MSWTNIPLAVVVIAACGVFVAICSAITACWLFCWKEGKDQARHDAAMKKKDDDRDTQERLRNLELNQREMASQMLLSNVPNAPSNERDSSFDTVSGLARSVRGGDGSALLNARQWVTQVADPITVVVHRTSRSESEASRSDDQLRDSESSAP